MIQVIPYFNRDGQLDKQRLLEKYADVANINTEDLIKDIQHLPEASELELCQGHDLLTILAILLGRILKSEPKPNSGDGVMNMMRACSNLTLLRTMPMYQNLEKIRKTMKLPELFPRTA